MEKQDLRIKKSKMAMRQAFLDLLGEKGYQNITVKDIADRAMVNRKTFYFHYNAKEDLYAEIMNDILNTISPVSVVADLKDDITKDVKKQHDLVISFLDNLKSVRKECRIMISDETNKLFSNNLKEKLAEAILYKEDILQRLQYDYPTFDLLVDVYFSTFTRVLRWWLDNEHEDPLKFLEMIHILFSSKPLEMLGLKEETLNEYGHIH